MNIFVVDDPQWEKAGRIHDWRNYVGARTRDIWQELTLPQKLAIAQDANDQAAREDWE